MGEAGIICDDERVELIRGQVVTVSPTGNWHAASVQRLSRLLHDQLESPIQVAIQNAINMAGDTQVEPDVAVLRPGFDVWESGLRGEDCLLIIEVAQSSLESDRSTKLRLYAEEAIPEYWVVDLEGRRVERYRKPSEARFMKTEVWASGDVCRCEALESVMIPVAEIVPPADQPTSGSRA
ncbi:MAG: Uma2 family endonuclease [Rhodothermales bacterium]|nr:Uma2 family endonuclease [Rhodothermales bacterium]MBO6779424.1 Uma2 family endonuclease [Rhodothermales bacterium]